MMIAQFQAARKVSTPLIAIQTPDPETTKQAIIDAYPKVPILSWDIVRGVQGIGQKGIAVVEKIIGDKEAQSMLTNPTEALAKMEQMPELTICLFYNMHLFFSNESVIQGIWNLRDTFKLNQRTLVMLVSDTKLPKELQDTYIIDEPLPSSAELRTIVIECLKAAELNAEENVLNDAVDALNGLSSFTAEQAAMMALSPKGIDIASLWEQKRASIEQSPGLSVWRGGETFDDIGGVANAKSFLHSVIKGKKSPNVILFIDEIEKALAGSGGGDLSGTSAEMLGTLLSWMQDREVTGILAIGPPGSAKSMIAKATGNTARKPTVRFDLGGMKGSLVGESNARLRSSLKVVDAISGGRVLCIATCNSLANLPPELRRRFAFGTFFFDLPSSEDRKQIWDIYFKKYEFEADLELPGDNDWTGAEIKQCCEIADRLGINLVEAASYIVPVAVSAKKEIEQLRDRANHSFISASYPGVYEKDHASQATGETKRRKVY